jgi:hypothetical protein
LEVGVNRRNLCESVLGLVEKIVSFTEAGYQATSSTVFSSQQKSGQSTTLLELVVRIPNPLVSSSL